MHNLTLIWETNSISYFSLAWKIAKRHLWNTIFGLNSVLHKFCVRKKNEFLLGKCWNYHFQNFSFAKNQEKKSGKKNLELKKKKEFLFSSFFALPCLTNFLDTLTLVRNAAKKYQILQVFNFFMYKYNLYICQLLKTKFGHKEANALRVRIRNWHWCRN